MQDNSLTTIAEAARRLADALAADIELAQNRVEHQRLSVRALEAARIAGELESARKDGA